MIRALVKTMYIFLLLVVILAGFAVFLCSTTPGLRLLIGIGNFYLPGTIKIEQLQGSLLNHFTANQLEYHYHEIKIKIKQLEVQWQPDKWLKNHSLSAQWHELQGEFSPNQTINSPTGTLTAIATLPRLNSSLTAKIALSKTEHWQLKSQLEGSFPWKWIFNASLIQPADSPGKTTGLHANLSARGVTTANNIGHLVITVHPGYYQMIDYMLPAISFQGGDIDIILSPKKLEGKGVLVVDSNKNLRVAFQLPGFSLAKGLVSSQEINSELRLDINSLDFLQNISPEISKLKGQMTASFTTIGTLSKPQLVSQLILNKISLYLPKWKLNLDAIDLHLISKAKHWDITGSVTSSKHTLSLKGAGTLDSQYQGEVAIEGNDFPLIQTSEYQIHISPRLQLHFSPTTRVLSGSILIPYAQIRPQTFNNSETLPEEVVYKKPKETSPTSFFDGLMDISIEMGKNVEINVKGLKGHVEGTLHVKQLSQGEMNAYGELSVQDGTYKAYGQDLAIKQGQLIFTGGPITNPGINLRATKKINNSSTAIYTNTNQLFDFNSNNLQSINLNDNMTLGVEVTGRLTSPKVQLFSEPAILSQADILSMLVLGRPANQANKAGGQLLLAAISSMNVGGTNSTQLLEQLKQTSGLDFDVQTNTNYNQQTNTVSDSTAFVVGKSLSKRLYLSYNIGLSQTDTNMLTLKYLLNKFFSIQVSTSDNSNAIDFLYTSHKRK